MTNHAIGMRKLAEKVHRFALWYLKPCPLGAPQGLHSGLACAWVIAVTFRDNELRDNGFGHNGLKKIEQNLLDWRF